MAIYCNACGAQQPGANRYCPSCGRGIPAATMGRRIPLERPRVGRKVAGVCLAFANEWNLDPTLVRVVWAVASILFGAIVLGVVAYAVAWVLIPEEPLPVAAPVVNNINP
ncbi:MAG TPA: PspC domain-containing protein [Terriglobales bacterium]